MNHYVNWLHDVAKLVYIVGNYEQAAKIKKWLDPSDNKNKVFFRCVQDFPQDTFKKVKVEGAREGIIRAHWLQKTLQKYPEMVIFLFSLGEESDIDKVEGMLKQILRKINLFVIDVLKQDSKEEVVVRIVITLTKAQMNNILLFQKVSYYMKSYEKDSFILCVDSLAKDIAKYRYTWMNYLQKNYEKKLKKIQRKLEEAVSQERRICYSFKQAIFYQVLGREEKVRYGQLYNNIKVKFSDLTSKEFTFLKYLQIRELRIIGDITVLRSIKGRIIGNSKQIPSFIQDHINFFKMRNLDPNSCHFYYYFEELAWRAAFIEQVLEVLGAIDIIEQLPHNVVAEWLNGLLSYLYKIATVSQDILGGLGGQILKLTRQNYLGRYDYGDVTDADIVMTETTDLLSQRKDLVVKGIQLITRYKCSGLFKENQINFLNIYLIRFHLAEGKFAAITEIYNQILKVEVNRCNYFLINQLFKSIEGQIHKADPQSRTFIYGVISLICDYFQNTTELNKYLDLFLKQPIDADNLLVDAEPPPPDSPQNSLFKNNQNDFHIFKLKKNSMIFAVKVLITQQIILGNDKYQLKLNFFVGKLVRDRLKQGNSFILIKFNHSAMVHKVRSKYIELKIQLSQDQGEWIERDVNIEPLQFIHRDAVFHIDEIQLIMEQQHLIWLIERSQLHFERYDSTMFHSKIRQPEIEIINVKKLYYLNQTFSFQIRVKEIQDCQVSAKLSVIEQDELKTQFFLNKDDKTDLTNSKRFQELVVGNSSENECWVKCNKLGFKTIKLQFNILVQKSIEVGWRDKPLHIKSNYNSTAKEIRFNVLHPFIITKTFKEAVTGNLNEGKIPLHKKMLLCFNIRANDHISVTEVTHHNNPRKVTYIKNFKMAQLHLAPSDSVKLNMLFMLNEDCADEHDLFLTTLFIKWRREGSPIDNVTLDENTMIRPVHGNVEVTFQQKNELVQKKKGAIVVKVRNVCNDSSKVNVVMESNENILRIGEKGKWKLLGPYEASELQFSVICMKSGIFQPPGLKVFVNNAEVKVNTASFLVQCE